MRNNSPTPETEESPWVDINRFKMFENPGDTIAGVMVSAGSVETAEGGRIGQFTLLDEDGFVTFNETAQLAILRKIPAGIRVMVVYGGEEKNGKNRLRRFDVKIAREDLNKVGQILMRQPAQAALPSPASSYPEAPPAEEYFSE